MFFPSFTLYRASAPSATRKRFGIAHDDRDSPPRAGFSRSRPGISLAYPARHLHASCAITAVPSAVAAASVIATIIFSHLYPFSSSHSIFGATTRRLRRVVRR